jgi:chemotaxis protein CheZ
MEVVNDVETQLLQVLIDNSHLDKHAEKRHEAEASSLQNGPQVVPGNPEAVTGQAQVDDLLESLGF